ncbi:mechanosensitive ion channel domain-containing protein [Crocosphaera sp. Alani8]|uniref:mechanosensitive ion channel domain-containing protein n=1 Tax=Crocosphaera sp. Alani8 TaxID=3038952 RepID=UPI00313ED74A
MSSIFQTVISIFNYPIFTFLGQAISFTLLIQIISSLILVFILARLIKLLFQNWVFKKFKIESGQREAFSTLIFYFLITLGSLICLQSSGLNLQSLAVVAGGLGIGIGFGLQTILRDFVSGLILLLGRAIKVNDYIQFGHRQEFSDVRGTVEKISLLFTVIKTKDSGFIIIPNSYLVTYPILNWSYNKTYNRVKIPLKVGKNIDFVLFTEIVLNTVQNEFSVKSEPSPKLVFKEIKTSYCEFELQVWIDEMKEEDMTINSINYGIEHHLKEYGINIIFPTQQISLANRDFYLPISISKNSKVSNLTDEDDSNYSPISVRDILKKNTYFSNLTPLELRQLIEMGYRKKLDKNKILFNEEDPGDSFYIILSGSVDVFVPTINKHLVTLRAGDIFGELALILGITRTASVKTLEKTRFFVIDKVRFKKLLQEQSNFAEVILEELSQHQEELTQRQKQLREMGLVSEEEDDSNVMNWLKKRLNNLFLSSQ